MWAQQVSLAVTGCVILIADALLIYRLYMIYIEHWWVTILPILTSVAAVVLFFIGNYVEGSGALGPAATALTVTTNVVITGLISFRLLRARRSLSKLLPSADMHLYTGVVAILIESALPLSLFGILAAVMQQLGNSAVGTSVGFLVCDPLFAGLFYSFCTLSPHMIIFRVTTGRSFTKFPSVKDGALNTLQFAHHTAESSFLQSNFNRDFGRNRDLDADAERGLDARDGVPSNTQPLRSIIQTTQDDSRDVEKA
ncbi:hypothetical protein EST38_g8450 [Candolleomyces aberdarensis]|uniref:Uncharacterized protein n=1 Tax=Candolleomyces aberdarensis TaxID=2316362 RepID=A0A4Q2DCG5_9AGAR|nr:hypothetical protein EST38_g8450 [Candolleomyces aberdarensis]